MAKTDDMIFSTDGGTGDVPVVIFHALAGNSCQWKNQLADLRKTRRAVALDLPGHGHSAGVNTAGMDIEMLISRLSDTLESLSLEKFILAGHSMGAAIASAFSARYPEKVAGLLLLDPAGDSTRMPKDQVSQYLTLLESEAYHTFIQEYWNQLLEGSTSETRTQILADLRATGKATVLEYFKMLFVLNPVPYIESYTGPKQIVYTDCNNTPISIHNICPDLPSKHVTGTGHWLQLDKHEETKAIFSDFIGKIR